MGRTFNSTVIFHVWVHVRYGTQLPPGHRRHHESALHGCNEHWSIECGQAGPEQLHSRPVPGVISRASNYSNLKAYANGVKRSLNQFDKWWLHMNGPELPTTDWVFFHTRSNSSTAWGERRSRITPDHDQGCSFSPLCDVPQATALKVFSLLGG